MHCVCCVCCVCCAQTHLCARLDGRKQRCKRLGGVSVASRRCHQHETLGGSQCCDQLLHMVYTMCVTALHATLPTQSTHFITPFARALCLMPAAMLVRSAAKLDVFVKYDKVNNTAISNLKRNAVVVVEYRAAANSPAGQQKRHQASQYAHRSW